MPAVSIFRSDKFPVGTSVGAYAGQNNRHHEGKPSGTAVENSTVGTDGKLTFPSLPEGMFTLYAEVESKPANMLLGNYGFTAPGSLKQRIKAVQELAGV